MKETTVYTSITNGGDGPAHNVWFLTQEESSYHNEHWHESWGEECTEAVETYIGSNIHLEASENSIKLAEVRA